MKTNRYNFFFILMLIAISFTLPFLMSHTTHNTMDSHPTHRFSPTVSPQIPAQVSFAGQTIRTDRYDLRERLDRELSSFSYMHSSTMLILKRANRYFPVIEPILKANGVPDDFKYLMAIESNLDTRALSHRGAAGLWQFMKEAGKEYGLEVNTNIDERYHIEKSTRAACRYLKKAYSRYGNWMSAAASYNAGMGRISSSLKEQNADTALDLWLNEETSRYMFRILAIKTIFAHPSQYGFHLTAENFYPMFTYRTDTLKTGIENLAVYAQTHGITYAQLKDANPWLRSTSLENKSGRTYVLKIPHKTSIHYDPSKTRVHNANWLK